MKKFGTSLYGYNKEDVNNFVAEVIKEYESMLNNLKSANEENKKLINEIEHYKDMQGSFNKAILVAQDASTQIKKMAKDEYKTIVEDAKKNASRIVNDALLRAEKIERDSEELRRKTIILKRRLRQEIEASLESIEDIGEN
ncbi:MAG: DivIVA domain-containing protein [Firmicutes bacterium]|nr:DivIVA domain-containing protein [Bacillota bacterium]